jgi:16S rRNA (guanine527-N7)-methyltransferase
MIDFKNELQKLGIELTSSQEVLFEKYYQALIEANTHINLTAITEKNEVYIKHFYDSLLTVSPKEASGVMNLCDVGSGAGFPSIPLKIIYPHIEITIIEPTTKKVRFLEQLVLDLELKDVYFLNKRAEEAIISLREHFDVVTARAVAKLDVLAELTIPFVKVGGKFISLKGHSYKEELEEAKGAISKLGGVIQGISEYDLPGSSGKRGLITITKVSKTNPIFPRRYALIKKKPL